MTEKEVKRLDNKTPTELLDIVKRHQYQYNAQDRKSLLDLCAKKGIPTSHLNKADLIYRTEEDASRGRYNASTRKWTGIIVGILSMIVVSSLFKSCGNG